MGLIGEIDWEALGLNPELRKLFAQQPADTRAPLSQGLLAMGAQMLANSNRGFAPALGAGAMGFMDASNAERSRQQKDPMQQINMLNAVMGLQQNMGDLKLQSEIRGAMGGGEQAPQFTPAPGLPQNVPQQVRGMFDRGIGDQGQEGPVQPSGGYLGSMSTPVKMPAGLNIDLALATKMALGKGPMAELGRLYINKLTDTVKTSPGDDVSRINPFTGEASTVVSRPNLDKNMRATADGGAEVVPGATEAIAALVGATERAKVDPAIAIDKGKSDNTQRATMMKATINGKEMEMPVDMYQQIVRYNLTVPQAQQASTALMDASASPVGPVAARMAAVVKTPLTGMSTDPSVPMNTAPAPQGAPQLGVDPIKQAAEKAQAVQAATMSGDLQQTLARDAYKTQMADLTKSRDSAKTAVEVLMSINESRSALEDGAITGGFGKAKITGLNYLNSVLPFQLELKPELLGNSQRLASSLGQQLVKHAKDLGFNPSNADATRLEKVIGDEGLSEKGIRAILEFQEKMARQTIDRHNNISEQAAKKGAFPLFDYKVDAPEPFKPKASKATSTQDAVDADYARRLQVPKLAPSTQRMHIENIIRNGTPEQQQMLRERGLWPQ